MYQYICFLKLKYNLKLLKPKYEKNLKTFNFDFTLKF